MDKTATPNLDALRITASAILLPLLWLHLPIVAIVALLNGTALLWPSVMAIVLAGAATASWWVDRAGPGTRLTVAVALIGMVSLLVFVLSGPWQIDLHMYYFAAFALIAAYCDWRAVLAAAATTALHHLILNFAYPAAVFPGGADFARVVLHAVIVVLECGVLIWLTHQLATLFAASSKAIADAGAANARQRQLEDERRGLEAKSVEQRRQAMISVAGEFERNVLSVVREVGEAVDAVGGSARSLTGTTETVKQRSAAVASASAQASTNVQTVAAASEELSASITEISRQVSQSATIAGQAVTEADHTNTAIQGLAEAAQKIGDVVKLINDIAGQTNLLALNATIEAARAGEAGKGFAVVASEVKSLATQTAKATEDISAQVSAIQSATQDSVRAIAGIGKTIGEINQIATTIAAAVEEQGAATQEIARNVQEAARGTAEASENITGVTQAAGESGQAAGHVLTASETLTRQAAQLRSQVDTFLAQIKSA
jgi:methyl-accepting chemotaxis protein